MSHSIVPQIIELATPIAESLGLEVVTVVFQTNKRPTVLRVDVRNLTADTSLDDCEKMSRALEETLETSEILPDSYVLEISSPGISRELVSDREFISFKGFDVVVWTKEIYLNQKELRGKLLSRDDQAVHLNQKGKRIVIPRELISKVRLDDRV
jgi:ribosome maturation factor RimP